METKGKTFEIKSFEQLSNIANESNMKDLLMAFCMCFDTYIQTCELYREHFPEECEGKLNSDLFSFGFQWTDDGKNEITKFKYTNVKTGEFTVVETKPKDIKENN